MGGEWYLPIYFAIALTLSMLLAVEYCLPNMGSKRVASTDTMTIIIAIPIAVWLGLRPIDGAYFGDTDNYALWYELLSTDYDEAMISGEWLWEGMMILLKTMGIGVHGFMLVVELMYFGITLWALYRLFPRNMLIGLAFVMSSLMFYSYGTNGLRNGLACQIVLVAITYFNRKNLLLLSILLIAAISMHRTALLPIAGALVGWKFIKNAKASLLIWVAALILSLATGDMFSKLLSIFDFDSRIALYTSSVINVEQFSKTGFRWDFLLYSMLPIAMIAYVSFSSIPNDKTYRILSVAYCLSNAAWLLLMYLPFCNRIGYLSWFLMPVVIVYPLVKYELFSQQERLLGIFLLANVMLSILILHPIVP